MAENTGEPGFSFGPFLLLPEQRQLQQSGQQVRLGSRAFDLLVALVSRAGQVVGKDELIAAAWPGTFVEETSLRVHISSLRKALGEDQAAPRIVTNIPGRGYCFVAPLTDRNALPSAPTSASLPSAPPAPRRALPRLGGRVIGRDELITALGVTVTRRCLVTLVGPGGIGKTTVATATAAATQVSEHFTDGFAFVDLTAIGNERLVPNSLAAALGHIIRSDDPTAELVAVLRGKHLLVVLDNCEHVVGAAAALAEALGEAPGVHVLATSREPLRVNGEWVQRLPPLELPRADPTATSSVTITAAEAMASAAVELFTERAAASLGGYVLTDADAPIVTEICRRLDGMALAIELAAGRVDTMGLRGLADSIDDCLRVLTQGRRTALPRHQTLRATLDWSYQLLSASEQAALRRLAAFNGPFVLEAARAVAKGEALPVDEVDECVRGLVAKSLATAELEGESVQYRLLATTRAYGRERLEEMQERNRVACLHAAWFQGVFERARSEWETRSTAEWLAEYTAHLPNLRAALEWAFAPEGDAVIGVALTVAAVPLWFELSQIDECLSWVQRALAVVEADPSSNRRQRMQLHAVLGWPSMRAISGVPKGPAAWNTTLALAEELGDVDFQLRALWALWVARTNAGEPRAALALADRFCRLETEADGAPEQRIGPRMRARSLHLLGRPVEGQAEVAAMLSRYVAPAHRSHVARFQYDQRVTARITLGRVLWVQGQPDQAMREMENNIAQALSLGHVLTLTHALSDGACPVALLAGDLAAAERFTTLLEDNTGAHALDVWHSYAACFRGELLVRRGKAAEGVALLTNAIGTLQRSGFVLYRTAFLCALAKGLTELGRFAGGLAAIDDALEQCERTGEAWCRPELMRVRGRLSLAQDDEPTAEGCFRRSLQDAEEQGALSWALVSATDLARLLGDRGEAAKAAAVLKPVHARFREGFATPDFIAATALLAELRAN